MALLTLRRAPSITNAPDENIRSRGRLQKRESFALVKGAVLLLEDDEREEESGEDTASANQDAALKQEGGACDTRHRHVHAMVSLLRPQESIRLAVQLESVNPSRVRYLIVVSTLSNKMESILLGMDFTSSDSDECTIGLVVPIWSDTQVYLDGDGGFSVTSAEETRIFKPVSMQTMWSVLQALHGCCERALKGAIIPGCGLDWLPHYRLLVESDRLCLNEWSAMNDLESVRRDSGSQSSSDRLSKEMLIKEHLRDIMRTEDLENLTSKMVRSSLEDRIGFDMRPYKEYIDNEMMVVMAQMDKPSKIFDFLYLGSEWNAANSEELQKNNVGYILNVTREIDNFFPESFTYMNIRVYDVEATDLLPYWKDTYTFIDRARKSGQSVLVHCKMGVSRSASTVVAFAMKSQRWPLEVALAYVRDRRSIVKPNDGFMRQLHTYSGILNASQQRHSALWRRKSRDQRRQLSLQGEEGEEEEEEEEEEGEDLDEEEDEGIDADSEDSDEGVDISPDEMDTAADREVFEEDSAPQSATNQDAPKAATPTITINEGQKEACPDVQEACPDVQEACPSPSPLSAVRSGRMNLFSLMQSISLLDDEMEQLPASPSRSPRQRRRSQHGRSRGLVHQSACVDSPSPEPPRQEVPPQTQEVTRPDGAKME